MGHATQLGRRLATSALVAAAACSPAPVDAPSKPVAPPAAKAEAAPAAAVPAAPKPPAPKGLTGRIGGVVIRGEEDLPEPGRAVVLLEEGAPPRTAPTDGWGRFEFGD